MIRCDIRKFNRKSIDLVSLLSENNDQKYINFNNYKDSKLHNILSSFFPIISENINVSYCGYSVIMPKFSESFSIMSKITYACKITIKLFVEYFEESVYYDMVMSSFPIKTMNDTFIINGVKKHLVSQIKKSFGPIFRKINNSVICNITPLFGSFLSIELSSKGFISIKVSKYKKIGLLPIFYSMNNVNYFKHNCFKNKDCHYLLNIINVFSLEIKCEVINNHIIINNINSYLDLVLFDKYNNTSFSINNNSLCIPVNKLVYAFIIKDEKIYNAITLINNENGFFNILFPKKKYFMLCKSLYHEILYFENNANDLNANINILHNILNDNLYDISYSGRFILNYDIGSFSIGKMLTYEDLFLCVIHMFEVFHSNVNATSVDSLSIRNVRTVDEFIDMSIVSSLTKIKKMIFDTTTSYFCSLSKITSVLNGYYIVSDLKNLFYISQNIQFLEQTNILSEISHKRRFNYASSSQSKHRISFEVRDVNNTYYGKICPIETPEGLNIGLINSLSVVARINNMGFIETPYYIVKNGIITNDIVYMTSHVEYKYKIAIYNVNTDRNDFIIDELVLCRYNNDRDYFSRNDVEYIEVSPYQTISLSTSLIPFLEHDDARRTLMGANMQKQALPLLYPDAPIIGTGIESVVSKLSGSNIYATDNGIVIYQDNYTLSVLYDNGSVAHFSLTTMSKTNMNTVISQVSVVMIHNKFKIGDLLVVNNHSVNGELAIGKNILVSFMSWHGYNFEDSIVVSERLLQNDTFTSIQIVELSISAESSDILEEIITKDIVSHRDCDSTNHLNEYGIVNVGTYVTPDMILVGRIVPKEESLISPEERLLSSIFGVKSQSYKNISLRVPHDVSGIVIGYYCISKEYNKPVNLLCYEHKNIQSHLHSLINTINYLVSEFDIVFDVNKYNVDNNDFIDILSKDINILHKKINNNTLNIINKIFFDFKEYFDKSSNYISIDKVLLGNGLDITDVTVYVQIAVKRVIASGDKLAGRHGNKGVISKIVPIEDMPFMDDGTPIDIVLNPLGIPSRMNIGQILETHLGLAAHNIGNNIKFLLCANNINDAKLKLKQVYEILYQNSNIPFCVDDTIKNLSDGKLYFSVPSFNACTIDVIEKLLNIIRINSNGTMKLRDGYSGDYYNRPISVGYQYLMRLHHIANEKLHVRSIGPYSLINQQPTAGKANKGGQRFGEMEVWGLLGHGAYKNLHEILTIKSDDMSGRYNLYLSMVYGKLLDDDYLNQVNYMPESFNVLSRLLNACYFKLETINLSDKQIGSII